MPSRFLSLAFAASITAFAATAAQAQSNEVFVPVTADGLEWAPITPPGFDAGMEIAGLHGDPAVDGGAYTLRLRFPDGYRFPPHFHPRAENVTVLSGTFLLAMGEEADEGSLESYEPGDYLFLAAEHPHFGGAQGVTTIQLHGTGPFEIIVVGSPEDKRGQ